MPTWDFIDANCRLTLRGIAAALRATISAAPVSLSEFFPSAFGECHPALRDASPQYIEGKNEHR
jgi:hypothetical protein